MAESDRDAFLMYALGELTYPEVAEAMGIPVGTVRSKIFRVRRVLRERLVLEGAISLQYAEGREG